MKPYEENKNICLKNSYNISNAIKNSDVFVMISDNEGTDMFMELGLAVGNHMEKNSPRVYVVGKYNNRSLMHFHPSIDRVSSIENVFEKECPEILLSKDYISPKFE